MKNMTSITLEDRMDKSCIVNHTFKFKVRYRILVTL